MFRDQLVLFTSKVPFPFWHVPLDDFFLLYMCVFLFVQGETIMNAEGRHFLFKWVDKRQIKPEEAFCLIIGVEKRNMPMRGEGDRRRRISWPPSHRNLYLKQTPYGRPIQPGAVLRKSKKEGDTLCILQCS